MLHARSRSLPSSPLWAKSAYSTPCEERLQQALRRAHTAPSEVRLQHALQTCAYSLPCEVRIQQALRRAHTAGPAKSALRTPCPPWAKSAYSMPAGYRASAAYRGTKKTSSAYSTPAGYRGLLSSLRRRDGPCFYAARACTVHTLPEPAPSMRHTPLRRSSLPHAACAGRFPLSLLKP